MSATPGATSRPPKTPRPWPVVQVGWDPTQDDAAALVQRWESGEATPFMDELSASLRTRAGEQVGAPPSIGTARRPAHAMVYTFVLDEPGAVEVLLWVNRLADETSLDSTMMQQVPGTGLWVLRVVMPSDWHASYCFLSRGEGEPAPWRSADQVSLRSALDAGARDERCAVSSRNRAGVTLSVVRGPDAPRVGELEGRAVGSDGSGGPDRAVGAAGVLTRHRIGEREVVLHEPADVAPDVELDVAIVLDGEVWIEQQDLPEFLDAAMAEGLLPPRRTLFVHSGGREQRWRDLGGGGDPVSEVADVLVPWIRAARACTAGPHGVAVVGQSLGGLTALRAVLERPDAVGVALSASASLWQDDLVASAERCVALDAPRPRIHLSHGAQEWVLAPGHSRLVPALEEAGVSVKAVSHQGGHDYAWWGVSVLRALQWWSQQE